MVTVIGLLKYVRFVNVYDVMGFLRVIPLPAHHTSLFLVGNYDRARLLSHSKMRFVWTLMLYLI